MSTFNRTVFSAFLAAFSACLAVTLVSQTPMPLAAQEEGIAERAPSAKSAGVFGRFFPSSKSQRTAKPATQSGSAAGGLLVPLKSFSNIFKGRADTISEDGVASDDSSTSSSNRIPSEPFQDGPSEDFEAAEENFDDLEEQDDPAQENRPAESNIDSSVKRETQDPRPSTVPPSAQAPTLGGARRSFAGVDQASEASSAPRVELPQASGMNGAVAGKQYEATPRTGILDRKGTSRRKPGTTQVRAGTSPSSLESTPVASSGTPEANTAPTAQPPSTVLPSPTVLPPKISQAPTANPRGSVRGIPEAKPADAEGSAPLPNVAKFRAERREPIGNKPKRAVLASRTTVLPSRSSKREGPREPNSGSPKNAELDVTAPSVRLQVTGPEALLVGQSATYEVTATNEGPSSLRGLSIRVRVPAEVAVQALDATQGACTESQEGSDRWIVWKLESLDAGSSPPPTLKIPLKADRPEHFAMSIDWSMEATPSQLAIQVQQPQLQLALEGPSEVDYGKPQIYRVRVANPGNATARDVMVELSAEPFGNNQSAVGDIPPGGDRVVEVELTFQQPGRIPIRAQAVSQLQSLESSSSIEIDVKHSQLVATWIGPEMYYQGNPADYIVRIENQGSIAAVRTECQVQLPDGVEVLVPPPGAVRTGRDWSWEIDRLEPAASREFVFQVQMKTLGENAFVFSAENASGDPVSTSLKTQVEAIADLHLTVNDPVAPAPVGRPVEYEITVSNRGTKSAESVLVIAQFSEGIEPSKIEGHTGQTIPGQVLFDPIPSIGPGDKVVLKITAEADKPGMHRFRAVVRCQGTEDDILKEESTRYTATASAVRSDRR